ncbi:N-acetylmuramoyl-L-alanine amidase [Gilvimarinus sp. 1_MG-2023]|uniref:N-acetylmuramoyl-L-alanine amidase n=1 Tax=Gilvimarinus sp. 1_MG-2023 TaxID=3062638 RepID=UPI0026E1AF3D|nr:N-acetylmuramoyl-L-alanine amidase [Gilvimarinus sp. 1_MG-2023]MDO6747185.1 N-acetylmuramoyl-L-alanine amidase [Gilvimarinus sp. 1_MG-2023]
MEIKYLVVHCADTPDTVDHYNAADVHAWHKARGWDGIGYHAVITRDGTVEAGRPEYWQGAHVAGHNSESLGVCLIGRKLFTLEQYRKLKGILVYWLERHPNALVIGHRDLDPNKACPNFDVRQWWAENDPRPQLEKTP